MLFKSAINLKSGNLQFIENCKTVTLYSAYLKLNELKNINTQKNIKQIIVRWEIQDLCLGVSDLELFEYCQLNGIALFRNTRIHLKAFWDNGDSVFFGSANVTGRGIGEKGNYNYELNGICNNMSLEDKLYLLNIIQQSEYVDDELYTKLLSKVQEVEIPTITYPTLPTEKKEVDYFLISQLPMTSTPEALFKGYSENDNGNSEIKNIVHDLSLYNIPLGLDKPSFLNLLSDNFNNHPFILKFKEAVKSERNASMRFGAVRHWFVDNCTTVPIPRTWNLNENIQILYDWICFFDDNYTWSRPGGYSQVIFFNKK